jgi:hypothetical protein
MVAATREAFDGLEVSAAWVAPVRLAEGSAVLKLGMPHMEGEEEIDGLHVWDGDPTVLLLDADQTLGAMLIESASRARTFARCQSSSRTW